MLKIAICDDEKECCENTAAFLNAYFSERRKPARISTFCSGEELISCVEEQGEFDIYFLDILMPELNGVDTAAKLKSIQPNGIIIYLTVSKDFAVESYMTEAFFYLMKPVKEEILCNVLNKAVNFILKHQNESIPVKTRTDTRRLDFDEIMYVELVGKSLCFHLVDNSSVLTTSQRISFGEAVEPLLKDRRFLQCGASFVVNLFYIKAVEKDTAVFKNGIKISLPKKACTGVRKIWMDYWLERGTVNE